MCIDLIMQLYYLSVATEIINIISYLSNIISFTLPVSFTYMVSIYNNIYTIFLLLVLFGISGKYRNLPRIILILSILKDLVYKNNMTFCILDSLVCIAILIYFNEKLYKANKERVCKQ